MPQIVRNLPPRPLRASEFREMRDTVSAHCVNEDAEAIYLLCVTNHPVRALGYDPQIDRWVQIFKTNGERFDPNRYNEFIATVKLWMDKKYWREIQTGEFKVNLPKQINPEDETE